MSLIGLTPSPEITPETSSPVLLLLDTFSTMLGKADVPVWLSTGTWLGTNAMPRNPSPAGRPETKVVAVAPPGIAAWPGRLARCWGASFHSLALTFTSASLLTY